MSTKRFIGVILFTSVFVSVGCGSKPDGGDRKSYIVVYKKTNKFSFSSVTASEDVNQKSYQLSQEFELGLPEKTFSAVVQGAVFAMTEEEALALREHGDVAYVEEDAMVSIGAVQTGAVWGLDRLDQEGLPLNGQYTYDEGTHSVNVYVIDTGVRVTHQEFAGRARSGVDVVDRDLDSDDCNGHGTHVAATVAGTTYGVAKSAQIIGVRVLNCAGSGRISDVISGIEWVTENHVKPAVANMSLGGGASQALDDAIRNSIQSGVTYVVAAGNDGGSACSGSPGRVREALTVGATTKTDRRASYSNHGSCLDIFAPGSEVTSAWYNSDTATRTIDGTSMAAPHVAGAAALFLSKSPRATPQEVSEAILGGATTGLIGDARSGSPNLLLNTRFLVGAPNDEEPPGDEELRSGDVVDNLSGQKGDAKVYSFHVHEEGQNVIVEIYGGLGDADLYLRYGEEPSLTQYDCRPYKNGNVEKCEVRKARSGPYHIMLRAFQNYEGVSLKLTVEEAPLNSDPCQACEKETGQLTGSGSSQFHPQGTYYQTTTIKTHRVWLKGPASEDFDLFLKKWDGGRWVTVASAATSGATESLTYRGGPGYYTLEIKSFLGSGGYDVWRELGD